MVFHPLTVLLVPFETMYTESLDDPSDHGSTWPLRRHVCGGGSPYTVDLHSHSPSMCARSERSRHFLERTRDLI